MILMQCDYCHSSGCQDNGDGDGRRREWLCGSIDTTMGESSAVHGQIIKWQESCSRLWLQ